MREIIILQTQGICALRYTHSNCVALHVYMLLYIVIIILVELVLDDQLLMAEAVSMGTQPVLVQSSHYHIEY